VADKRVIWGDVGKPVTQTSVGEVRSVNQRRGLG
jgi:hypothetical protein